MSNDEEAGSIECQITETGRAMIAFDKWHDSLHPEPEEYVNKVSWRHSRQLAFRAWLAAWARRSLPAPTVSVSAPAGCVVDPRIAVWGNRLGQALLQDDFNAAKAVAQEMLAAAHAVSGAGDVVAMGDLMAEAWNNLNDLPINDDWAARWCDKAEPFLSPLPPYARKADPNKAVEHVDQDDVCDCGIHRDEAATRRHGPDCWESHVANQRQEGMLETTQQAMERESHPEYLQDRAEAEPSKADELEAKPVEPGFAQFRCS